MFEGYTDKARRSPVEEQTPGIGDNQSGVAMEALRRNFAPLLERLTPEVEPATVFSLRPLSKEEPQ